jgi:serine/threonine protein kinase
VLVGNNGYPVIIDMGFAKKISKKTYTFCGTPLYVAPEIILNKGHDKGADHWSLGCLIYEMIDGETPFYKEGMDQMTLFKTIVKGRYDKSSRPMSSEVQDFVKRILVTDSSRRLGSLAKGINDLFRHKWFNDMDFEKLQAMEVPAPFVPKIKDPLDCSAFDDWSHLDDKEKVKDPPISKKDDAIFKVF